MSCANRLACVGDLMTDILVTAARPRDGMPDGIYMRPGGSVANAAAWATRAGCPSAWIGAVGSDGAGRWLLAELQSQGVVTIPEIVEGIDSGIVISRVGKRANRMMHSARWASNRTLSEAQFSALKEARAIHFSGYMLGGHNGPAAATRLLAVARQYKVPLSFDASDPGIVKSVGATTVIDLLATSPILALFANEKEAAELSHELDPERAAAVLAGLAAVVIVKAGRRGCYVAAEGAIDRVPAYRTTAIDTTGAGDAFAGTWLAHHLSGTSPVEASVRASQAAAQAIRQIGGRPPVTR